MLKVLGFVCFILADLCDYGRQALPPALIGGLAGWLLAAYLRGWL
jgi:hypothetical protein